MAANCTRSSTPWRSLRLICTLILICFAMTQGQIGRTYNNVAFPSAWTLQAELRVAEAGVTYGKTPASLEGRGYSTLISGYDRTNPGIYIHTNDDGIATAGRQVWSQQAKLIPSDGGTSTDEFGRWIVNRGHTILVSSPYATVNGLADAGAIYVFNGTLRHWTQTQKLQAADAFAGDHFGELMSLNNDRVVVSAQGSQGADFHDTFDVPTVGAAYVYERQPGGIHWSRQSKLFAKDMASGNFFSEKVGVYDDWIVSTARNDFEPGLHSGSAYMFKQTSGKWSQQQKLMAADLVYWQPERDFAKYEVILGVKVFANDIALEGDTLAAGYRRTDTNEATVNGVYIFNGYKSTNRWSLQQRLFTDTSDEGASGFSMNSTKVKMTNANNLVASVYGPNELGNTYLFKTFGNGWSLQQELKAPGAFEEIEGGVTTDWLGYTGSGASPLNYEESILTEPSLHGATLFHSFRTTTLLHSRLHNGSCLILWLSDHFLDGWDSVVLTVVAPDQSIDKFHPHCDQVDPFFVRYCPYQVEDEGVYIVKTFAAIEARFYWEISYQIQVEDTGVWYKGDFSTKMRFNFNQTSAAFNFFDGENLVDLDRPCYRCISLASKSWAEQQIGTAESFFPLDSTNAPWYISDIEGHNLVSMGNICGGVDFYQCYQRLADGFYVLRLGGGLFGRITGLPYAGAVWEGCGESGTDRDQLVFVIENGECRPLQKFTYTTRCDKPPPLDLYAVQGLTPPTAAGTAAPTVNVFGPAYVQYEMYSYDEDGKVKEKEKEIEENSGVKKPSKMGTILDDIMRAENVAEITEKPAQRLQHTRKQNVDKKNKDGGVGSFF